MPLCQWNGCYLVTGLGEMSIPAVRDMILRIARIGKPARIFYLSDFDPGGQSMPVAVARKAEWLIARDGLDLDLRLFPIVLTAAQIAEYNLPRTPGEFWPTALENKLNASAAVAVIVSRNGSGAWQQRKVAVLDRYSREEKAADWLRRSSRSCLRTAAIVKRALPSCCSTPGRGLGPACRRVALLCIPVFRNGDRRQRLSAIWSHREGGI